MAAMDEPTETEPTDGQPSDAVRRTIDVESGDRPPGRATRLDRPPSDRYARDETPAPIRRAGPAARAVGVALVGAATIAVLGGPLSLTAGLVAVAVVVGLILGAILRPASAAAVGLAVGSVIVGLLGVWLFARAEGGVLDPITYFADVEGLLAPIQLLLAALAAFVSSR